MSWIKETLMREELGGFIINRICCSEFTCMFHVSESRGRGGFCFLTCTLRRPPATSTVSMQPPCSSLYILSYGLIKAAVQRGGREPAEIRRADSRYCTSPRRKPPLCRTNSLRCRTPPSSRSLPSTHTHTLIQAQICRSGYVICVHAFSTHTHTFLHY